MISIITSVVSLLVRLSTEASDKVRAEILTLTG